MAVKTKNKQSENKRNSRVVDISSCETVLSIANAH